MSRSVSAPSSVTKTSPCWNGLIVPGSTLRYGSNFWHVTLSPRLSSRHPIDAAAMPLPSDETTPPVTNIYLANSITSLLSLKLSLRTVASNHCRFKQPGHSFQIVRRIHAKRLVLRLDYADGVTVFQSPQLLQAFSPFQGANRQKRIIQQKIPLVNVQSNMF